jgi:hypothetical protein
MSEIPSTFVSSDLKKSKKEGTAISVFSVTTVFPSKNIKI